MKKAALLLIVTSCIALVLASKDLLKDMAPMQSSSPDILPLFVITDANWPGALPARQADADVTPDNAQLRPKPIQDAVKTIIDIYHSQNQIRQ
nr:hypothetical protein [uncultured Chitinophaga sp.]